MLPQLILHIDQIAYRIFRGIIRKPSSSLLAKPIKQQASHHRQHYRGYCFGSPLGGQENELTGSDFISFGGLFWYLCSERMSERVQKRHGNAPEFQEADKGVQKGSKRIHVCIIGW